MSGDVLGICWIFMLREAAGAFRRRSVLRVSARQIGVLFLPYPKFAPLEMRRQRDHRGNVLSTIPIRYQIRLHRVLVAAWIVALDHPGITLIDAGAHA